MALHVILYVLRDEGEIRAGGNASPVARLDVNECMPLNAQLKDLGEQRRDRWGAPRVETQVCPRGFQLSQISADEHTCTFGSDYYGDPLTWLPAGDFGGITLEVDVEGESVDFSHYHADAIAALAYIKALPPKTPVVLYWI